MTRTFVFDDGETWHVELTTLSHHTRGTVSVGVKFWAAQAPNQRVLGRLSPSRLAISDAQLADALRQTLRSLSADGLGL